MWRLSNITTRPGVFWPFVFVDFTFGILSAIFLALEMWTWASIVLWLGIPPNLYFAFPALFNPTWGVKRTSSRPLPETVWVRNAGRLIFTITAGHVVAAIDPERFQAVAWLTVGGRLAAGAYWLVVVLSEPVGRTAAPAATE